jgi:hypothetical protein
MIVPKRSRQPFSFSSVCDCTGTDGRVLFSLTLIVPSKDDADALVKKIREKFGSDLKIKVEKVDET